MDDKQINDIFTKADDNTQNATENTALYDDGYISADSFAASQRNRKPSNKPVKRNSSRKQKRRTKAIITVCIMIAAAVLLATCMIIFISDYVGIRFVSHSEEVTVDIQQGSSTSQIADALHDGGIINSPLMFSIFCRIKGVDSSFKYGVYTISNEAGYKDIAAALQKEGKLNNAVDVTIPEGASVDSIMELLENKGVCKKSDFKQAMTECDITSYYVTQSIPEEKVYYKFEGYLFPDTYRFYNYDSAECAKLALQKMLKQADAKWTPEMKTQVEKSGYTVHQIMTMASIVEKESSASPNEMPKVAAVFYNRLSWDEPKYLGSSPTAKYPYGSGRYNTNTHEGLPPGPLCSPSLNAIKAALSPEPNFKCTYFVTDSDMKFYYSSTNEEHNNIIAKLRREGKWLG
ncbi:MAG: endolytic transglycosylase MltG [Oscillospiraceae bacterium]|nr:endolytic transglycosylase MltG [Candidatus Equicaccousia limihippi]